MKRSLTALVALALALTSFLPAVSYSHAPVSRYMVVVGPSAGVETLHQSMTLFQGLSREGYAFDDVYCFESLGVGGIFSASSDVAEALKSRLQPIIFLQSSEVSLPKSVGSVNEATGFDYFPGGSITGKGVKVAVIDTGVDYTHPALGGSFGVKVVGGYDFVNNDPDPLDVDGHGTAVAGILAGNTSDFRGVAPDAEILAYRVFVKEQTTSELIIKALDRAEKDGAQIINLSLGGGFTSVELSRLGYLLFAKGVELVAAIGNEGPALQSAQAPASLPYFLSVGASLSILSTQILAQVKIGDGLPLETAFALPGSPLSLGIMTAPTTFIFNGRSDQMQGVDLTGRIAVALRDHRTYFAQMEFNAANAGARALIVVNDAPESVTDVKLEWPDNPSYAPRIPVVAISGSEGASLANSTSDGTSVSLVVFKPSSPEYPSTFSSRGPADDFSVKPEVLAPGDSVVAPLASSSGYMRGSGSSFSSPQVAGALALLRQLHPELSPAQAYSMVALGATVAKGYFGDFTFEDQGAGVMNITKSLGLPFALGADYVMLFPSTVTSYRQSLNFTALGGEAALNLSFSGPYPLTASSDKVTFSGTTEVTIEAARAAFTGEFEDRLIVGDGRTNYTLPVRIIAGDVGLSFDPATGQISSTYSGKGKLTVMLPDGTIAQSDFGPSSPYFLQPSMTGFYRLTVSYPSSDGDVVGRLMVYLAGESLPTLPAGSDSLPSFVPLGVIVFSGVVAALALLLYKAEMRAVRIRGGLRVWIS